MPMKTHIKGFFDFIRTQGVVAVAVAFILGKAVSDLVMSIVNDLINPIIGTMLGRIGDLAKLSWHVNSANIMYGKFIAVSVNFTIVALVVYFGVKLLGLEKLDKPKQ